MHQAGNELQAQNTPDRILEFYNRNDLHKPDSNMIWYLKKNAKWMTEVRISWDTESKLYGYISKSKVTRVYTRESVKTTLSYTYKPDHPVCAILRLYNKMIINTKREHVNKITKQK